MAIAIPFESAKVSAVAAIEPGRFFYWLQRDAFSSDLCVGLETPNGDVTRRAFLVLTGGDRFRIKTTGHLPDVSVILLPDFTLSFKIGARRAEQDTALNVGNLSLTASGPVLLALPATGSDSRVYINLRNWGAVFEDPDFQGRFCDWQLVHTNANGIEQPLISMGSFDTEKSAPVVGSA